MADLVALNSDGSNLSLAVIARDQGRLKRLLDSLATQMSEFAGELVIGSREPIPDDWVDWEFKRVDLNGVDAVGGQRNRLVLAARHCWVLLLEDSFFFSANPIEVLQRHLETMASPFVNLLQGQAVWDPSHVPESIDYRLSLQKAEPGVRFSVQLRDSGEPTVLDGRAGLIYQPIYSQMGGYSEDLSTGLADLDFSLRVMRVGIRVGGLQAAVVEPQVLVEKDVPGFGELKLDSSVLLDGDAKSIATMRASGARPGDRRPRIALIVDGDDWAFANISRQVRRALADEFEFVTIPFTVVESTLQLLLMTEQCDLLHMFWREFPPTILSDWLRDSITIRAGVHSSFESQFIHSKALTSAVYDHLYLSTEELADRRVVFSDLLDGYSVGSERLRAIYEQVPGYPVPAAVLQDGVDLELFYPQHLERFNRSSGQELVVGWVGNSHWNDEQEDFKGVNTILRPALEQLRQEGLPVRADFVDRAENVFVPHVEMVHHYAKIDVYVCTSKIEGTPNPVLESMACGVPIITTDVGIVPEAFGEQQQRFVLGERSVECLKSAIRDLWSQPALFPLLSAENLERVKPWDWKIRASNFGPFFWECLRRRDERLAKGTSMPIFAER